MNILTLATDDGAFLKHIAAYFNGNSDAEIQRWADRLTRIAEKLEAKTEAKKDLSKLLESAREKETVFTDEEIRECYPFIRDNMPPHLGYPSLMAIIAGLSAERNRLAALPPPGRGMVPLTDFHRDAIWQRYCPGEDFTPARAAFSKGIEEAHGIKEGSATPLGDGEGAR